MKVMIAPFPYIDVFFIYCPIVIALSIKSKSIDSNKVIACNDLEKVQGFRCRDLIHGADFGLMRDRKITS